MTTATNTIRLRNINGKKTAHNIYMTFDLCHT